MNIDTSIIFYRAVNREIIPRLKNLLSVADPAQESAIAEDTMAALAKGLNADRDVRQRLTEIAEKSFTTPHQQCRQLSDMQLYLTLLNRHAQEKNLGLDEAEKQQLQSRVTRVEELSSHFKEVVAPAWKTHVDKLTKVIEEQGVIPYVRSQLQTHMGTAVDDKIFAHIHAEALIKGSDLEGNADKPVIQYLKAYLENNKERYSQMEGFGALLKMVRDSATLLPSDTFHGTLSAIIQALKPGEKTLIPSGWTHKEEGHGHSMKMSVERQENGKLRVLLYNAGSGIEDYHVSIFDQGELLYQPFIELVDVEEKRLLDPDFLQAYKELQTVTIHEGTRTDYSARDLYALVLKALGGKVVLTRGERDKFMPPQKSGICTWASFLAVLHTHLSTKDYYRMASDIAFDSLCAYVQKTKAVEEVPRHLLQHALTQTAQTTLDTFDNGAISLERLQEVHATLKELQDFLERAEGEAIFGKIVEEELNFNKVEPHSSHYISVKSWEFKNIESKGIPPSATPLEPFKPFSFDWMNNPNELVKGLKELNQRGDIFLIEQFFLQEAHAGREEIWKKIPQEQLAEGMVQLADLGEWLCCLSGIEREQKRAMTGYFYYLNALTLLLGSRIPSLKLESKGLRYQRYLESVSATLKGGGLIEDQNLYRPEERYLREKALAILSSRKKEQEFYPFNFEKGPYLTGERIKKTRPKKGFDYPEQRYVEKWLQRHPEAKNKLQTRYPGMDLSSPSRQIAAALCDYYGEILPPEFCALRRLNATADALQGGYFFLKSPGERVFKVKLEEDEFSYIVAFDGKAHKAVPKLRDFNDRDRFQELAEVRKRDKTVIWESEKEVMLKSVGEWKRHLQLILTQGDLNQREPHFEQQVVKAIAYFSDHFEAFEEHDMRMLCRYLLFEGTYLETLLEKNPAISQLLTQFVERGFDYFAARKNMAGAAFFMELGRGIDAILHFKGLPSTFPDFRKRTLDLLSLQELTHQERTALYVQLAASYESHPPKTFSPEDARHLTTALLYRKVFPPSEKITEEAQLEITRAKNRWHTEIQKQLKGEICTAIVQTFDPTFSAQKWDFSKFPLCSSQGYTLDATSLQLYKEDQPLAGLPDHVIGDERLHFKKMFGKTNYICRLVPNGYEFTDERGILTQVTGKIRQQLNGRWYERINTYWQVIYNFDFPKDFDLVCDRSTLWVPVENREPLEILVKDDSHRITHAIKLQKCYRPVLNLEEQKQVYAFFMATGEKEKFIRDELLEHNSFLLTILEDLSESEKNKIKEAAKAIPFTFEEKKEDPRLESFLANPPASPVHEAIQFIISTSRQQHDYVVQSCKKIVDEKTFLRLVDLPHAPDSVLKTVFKEGLLWREDAGPLKQLELPSLGLTFEMRLEEGQWRAYSEEYPGFFVSSNQRYRGLQAIEGAIVLENQAGKRTLILPYGEIRPSQGSLKTALQLNKSGQAIAFDLDAVSRPIAGHKKQQLYLAALLLAQKQYAQAQSLLRTSFSRVIPYSDEEVSLLEKVVKIPLEGKDYSPHATAVLLTALALLPPPTKEIWTPSGFKESLRGYQDQVNLIPDLAVSQEEEKRAREYLVKALQYGKEPVDVNFLPNFKITSSILLPDEPVQKVAGAPFFFQQLFIKLETHPYPITRPKESFARRFLQWYQLALQDPIKLEIYLSGAEHDPSVPQELVTFLRTVGQNTGQFPNFNEMNEIVSAKRAEAFLALIKKAKEWEQKKTAPSEIPLKGEFAKRRARTEEAQKIAVRPTLAAIPTLQPLSPRQPFLTDEQLKSFVTIDSQRLQLSREEIAALQKSVGEELAQHIEAYWNKKELQEPWHHIDKEAIGPLKTRLLVQQSEMGKQIHRKEQELLELANALPQNLQEALLVETEKIGHLRRPITLSDLTLFTARARHFTLTGKNRQIAEIELLQHCLTFFEAKAQQQQLRRALTMLGELEKSEGSTYARLSESCYKELMRKVPYKAHENPELLVFEVLDEIGLHDWQVKDLAHMLAPKPEQIILEKVMGSGKSKVYLPLLALGKADGDHLSCVVVGSAEYDSVAAAMQIKSGQMFSQVAHTFQFSRDSDTSVPALKQLMDECEAVRQQRHFLVITDKSMHNLALAFQQLWDSYLRSENDNPELAARLEAMRKLIHLFKEKARATFDEADLLLNCRFEVVYALGDPKPIEPEHTHVVADLYESIEEHLKDLSPFTKAGYDALKPKLIETYVKRINPQNPTLVTNYLNGGREGADFVNTLPKSERDKLAIALYEFRELLPIVLDRRCGEHYGYSDNPDKILPVPYVGNGLPSPTAEFSFPYSVLDYTVQTLQVEGVSPTLLKSLIREMQQRAEKEQKVDPTLALQETQGYKDFLELCAGRVFIPFLHVHDSDIDKLSKMYREHPPSLYGFAKKHLFPKVTQNERKLTSTPYTLTNLFYEVQGFTGTPWNHSTYPKQLTTVRDPDSAGKTQGIIWKNSQKVHELTTGDYSPVMQELAKIVKAGDYHAFIDVGALFLGIDNKQVAEDFLKILPTTIKGVLFFTDNRPFVLERGKAPTPFEQSSLQPKELFNFYDQINTTGKDFKIAGKSLLSISKNSKMRDLEQGYMRDRQAELGQRVEFIVAPETAAYIRKEVGTEVVNTGAILRSVETNQERELESQLLMASFGRLKVTIQKQLNVLFLDSPQSLRTKRELILPLIGDPMKDDPHEQLGRFPVEVPVEQFFEEIIEQTVQRLKPLLQDAEAFRKELWSCIDLKILPPTLSSASQRTPEQCVEQQSQTQLQQQSMAMVQKEQMSDLGKQREDAPPHWNWDPKIATTYEYFYRVTKVDQLYSNYLPTYLNDPLPISASKEQAPFLTIADILASTPHLQEFSDIFDLEASYNFLPIRVTGSGYASRNRYNPAVPFDKGQLEMQQLLICKERKTGKMQVRLISQADIGFFYQKLGEDRDLKGRERNVDATLYHPTLGIIQSNNPDIIAKREKLIDETVLKKIVQAKFFNGESLYNPTEMKILEEWIHAKGRERMKRLFCDHILPLKEEKLREYNGSPLFKLFAKISL